MRRGLFPLLAALAVGCGGGGNTPVSPAPVTNTVELTPVTVAELDAAVASHKGRVVLIDAWFLG
jgi:hypothetical protein